MFNEWQNNDIKENLRDLVFDLLMNNVKAVKQTDPKTFEVNYCNLKFKVIVK